MASLLTRLEALSWDTFAARYMAGVPLRLLGNLVSANMVSILSPADGPKSLQDLSGKNLTAAASTGTFRLTKAFQKEFNGFDLDSQVILQNVDNPATAVTLVMANRADAALSWEPNVSIGLHRAPDARVIYNLGSVFREHVKREPPLYCSCVRAELLAKYPDIARRLNGAIEDTVAGINANLDKALAATNAKTGVPADAMKLAITSGRMAMQAVPMSDETARDSVMYAANLLTKNGALPKSLDNGFFVV